jgi:hypothetical protein
VFEGDGEGVWLSLDSWEGVSLLDMIYEVCERGRLFVCSLSIIGHLVSAPIASLFSETIRGLVQPRQDHQGVPEFIYIFAKNTKIPPKIT